MEEDYRPMEYVDQERVILSRVRLAEAYVPYQKYGRTFSPREALEKGTLFPELYRPYPKGREV